MNEYITKIDEEKIREGAGKELVGGCLRIRRSLHFLWENRLEVFRACSRVRKKVGREPNMFGEDETVRERNSGEGEETRGKWLSPSSFRNKENSLK